MAEQKPVIEAEKLSVGYRGKAVVAGVELTVRGGEFWFLLGANGAGKTTFVRTMLGLIPPVSGTLRAASAVRGRHGLGFVPQHCSINPTLRTTVREFVRLGLVGMELSSAQSTARARRDRVAGATSACAARVRRECRATASGWSRT